MNKLALFKFRLARTFLLVLQSFFPKNTYILFDNLYEKNAECIDTWCIFQYMQKHNIRSYYVLWKENPMYQKLKGKKALKNIIVLQESCKWKWEFFYKVYWYLVRTKAVITSFGELHPKITSFLYKNKYINYIFIDHGTIFLKLLPLSTNYIHPGKFNQLLISSETERRICLAYNWKNENLIHIGLPRWSQLKRLPHKQKSIFMMMTWRHTFGRWNAKKFHTPLQETAYYKGINSLIQSKRLQNLLQKHNIRLTYTLHHSMLNQITQADKAYFHNIEYVPSENISQYIKTSDLFITDYSSLFADFLFINTPVCFFRPDFHDVSLLAIDRQDMQWASSKDKDLFNICYNVEETINCIEKYIQNGFILEPENIKKANLLFGTKEKIMEKFIAYLEAK